MIRRLLAGTAASLVASAAAAAPNVSYGVNAGVNAGYSSNPYLDQNGGHGTATISGSLSPYLTVATARSTTEISGSATYLKYLSGYGDSRSLSAHLGHSQTFSPTVSGNFALDAVDSTSALLNPFSVSLPVVTGDLGGIGTGATGTTGTGATGTGATGGVPTGPVTTPGTLPAVPTDIISSRQKLRQFDGSGALNWQVDARDNASANASVARTVYPGGHHDGVPDNVSLGNYWSYSGGLNVGRQVTDRTRVGVAVSAMKTTSDIYPDGSSISPGLTLNQKLSAHWSLDAGVSVIFETQDLPSGDSHSTELGFNLNLCGTFPRSSLCAAASRNTSPSGYGGLRTRLSGSVSGSYQLDARSSINGSVGYATDKGSGGFDLSSLSLLQANAGYSRTLTQRLALNASVGYQRSKYEHFGSADGVSASVGLSFSLGRNS